MLGSWLARSNGAPRMAVASASRPGVGEDKSLQDISAQDTRIHPGNGLKLEARNVLNSERKE